MPLPTTIDPVWRDISARISARTSTKFRVATISAVAGGCINSAARVTDGTTAYFVKFNAAERLSMFEAEADGLMALAASHTLRVPRPVCSGCSGSYSWLTLEYLDSLGTSASANWNSLGEGLAQMHQSRQQRFGWFRDNTVGATAQINSPCDDWIDFLRRYRIGYQLQLARHNGFSGRLTARGQALLDRLPGFFGDYTPVPSLLHGDLWSGNAGFLAGGEPVIFDPAIYFGDREADIAMTELFGGFAPAFYEAYTGAWPLDAGYAVRKHLYNLYHLLNHLNLFGSGYLSRCEATIDRLLANSA